jgi:hypothetical protein
MTDTTRLYQEVRDGLERLDRIVADMAAAAAPLFRFPTRARYLALLSACYHYTRDNGRQLRRAADLAPNDDLREFFSDMADDEQDHYLLAEADLKAVGAQVAGPAQSAIIAFADYWYRICPADYFQFLGATFALESLAGYLRTQALAGLSVLGLRPRESRFIRTHLEADAEHGTRVAEMCTRYLPAQSADIISGAEVAAWYWTEGVDAFLALELAERTSDNS